jgi:hypothetical protein
MCLVGEWVQEVTSQMEGGLEYGEWESLEEECDEGAWDDVNGGSLPEGLVREARQEEVGFMVERGIWEECPVEESWRVTGKAPVTVRWVDTNKGTLLGMLIRSRLVARDFKGGDKDRDDLFAETPPLEAKRMLISRTATRRKDGRWRKLMFIDAKKAHLNPKCEEPVYIELPEECGAGPGVCGRLNFWLYGFRKAASAWEALYSELLESVGFERGVSCGVVYYHEGRDISLAVHDNIPPHTTLPSRNQHSLITPNTKPPRPKPLS